MKTILIILLALNILSSACSNSHPVNNTDNGSSTDGIADTTNSKVSFKLEPLAEGFTSPIAAVFFDSGKALVCEQTGIVRLIENSKLSMAPYLDLRTKLVTLNSSYDERGLLGIALHPNFVSNYKFYVYYSAPSNVKGSDHKSIISEFTASANSKQANIASERIILTIEQPESNHNGGSLMFGKDGYLYIGLGDGGGAGDKHGTIGNGQNLNTLLGKILRIDINQGATYGIPKDNPFVGKTGKPEIWAYGLRNPWRFSFDRKTSQLFAGDVGQNQYEEVNIIEKGGNYGWKIMEATHCFDPPKNCKTEGLILPIDEYTHSTGYSVTGGYVYNGSSMPDIVGKYIFADWSGPLFSLHKTGNKWSRSNVTITNKPSDNLKILSFAEDTAGELYILTSNETGPINKNGVLYKLVKP